MIVYKIFHIPTGKYVMSMMDRYNLSRNSSYANVTLGKKGKNWNTKSGVIIAAEVLQLNCNQSKVPFKYEEFEIHELTLQITDRITLK